MKEVENIIAEHNKALFKYYLVNYATKTRSELEIELDYNITPVDKMLKTMPSITGMPIFWNSIAKKRIFLILEELKKTYKSTNEAIRQVKESFKEDQQNFNDLIVSNKLKDLVTNTELNHVEVNEWLGEWREIVLCRNREQRDSDTLSEEDNTIS